MASSEAPSDGLLAQHRLLLAVIDTDWATRLDHKVAAVIIQRYYPKYGNSRASLRFIADAVRSDRSNVIDSTRRLVHGGAFSVIREGKGTRPTEYGLNFGFGASGGVPTTSSDPDLSGGVGTTSCGGVATTARNSSGGVATTETCLPVTGLHAGLQERQNIDSPPPSAPPGMPLSGATGADVGKSDNETPFDELWRAYGHRQKRADARAAYEKLAPGADLHQTMVDAASAWRKHWERQNNPDAPRKALAGWLRSEGYMEDPPAGYKPKERKPKPPATAPVEVSAAPRTTNRPGPIEAQIVEGDVVERSGMTCVELVICNADDSSEWSRRITLESLDSSEQSEGQQEFASLCRALGVDNVNDTSELLFKPFVIKSGAGTINGPIEYAAFKPEMQEAA